MKCCAAIILARYDSSRLPGKAMKTLAGKPLLAWSVEPFVKDPSFLPVVATTKRECDNPICDLAKRLGAIVYRGSLEDVAGRTLSAARAVNTELFARVNGDSPFVRIDLLNNALNLMHNSDCKFCTNLFPRAFPYGISVEIFDTDFFENFYHKFYSDNQREHVTSYFYEKNLLHLAATIPYIHGNDHDVRLVVDTMEDHVFVEKLINKLDRNLDCELNVIVDTYRHQRNQL
jgi:spore coat polysaccharide biosynthesis protein SpsF